MKRWPLAVALSLASAHQVARANDSTAVLAAGGLVLTKSQDISALKKELIETYCVGPKLMELLLRLRETELEYNFVHYILTTGANWKGPIKSFKLTIVKRSADDKVSTCLPDTHRVSATAFEVVRKDFVPTQDLKLVYFTRTSPP